MITGFNTDVPFEGVTYHVQTEDKGLDTPLILSLVYVGGTIIASKRTPYEDLISKGFDVKALTERLQRQHKLICAAIKAGRVEELKRMSGANGGSAEPEAQAGGAAPAGRKSAGQRRKKAEPAPPAAEALTSPAAEETADAREASAAAPVPETATAPTVAEATPASVTEAAPAPPVEAASPAAEMPTVPQEAEAAKAPAAEANTPPTPKPPTPRPPTPEPLAASPAAPAAPAPKPAVKSEPEIVILATLADEIDALGAFAPRAEPKPPAPPVEAPPKQTAVTPAKVPAGPVLTAEILETPEDVSNELYLTLLDDEGEFRAGQLATVKVYVGRGTYGQRPEAEASVTVKVLGTSFRPIIMTTETDALGVGVVRALLPRFTSGRAAIIIRATAGDDAAEMRRIIHQ